MVSLEGADGGLLLFEIAELIEAAQQAVPGEGVDPEGLAAAVRQQDRGSLEVQGDLERRLTLDQRAQLVRSGAISAASRPFFKALLRKMSLKPLLNTASNP